MERNGKIEKDAAVREKSMMVIAACGRVEGM
jgi:hypothetical protein